MIEIKIDNDIFNIPESFSEISLLQYCELFYNLADNPNYDTKVTLSNEITILSRLMQVTEDYIKDLPIKLFNNLTEKIRWIYDSNLEAKNEITLEGIKYYIPNVEKFNVRQWIDTDVTVNEDNNPHKFLELLAILLIPVGVNKYDGDYKNRIEILKNLPANQALQLLYFFFQRGENLKKITRLYLLMQEEAPLLVQHTETLLKHSIGCISVQN